MQAEMRMFYPFREAKSLRLNICLVSPFPPPYGGIAHWTSMVTKYAGGRADVLASSSSTLRPRGEVSIAMVCFAHYWRWNSACP